MKRLRRWLRYGGVSALGILAACILLSYSYYRWDDSRVISAYGGDPQAAQYAAPFLAEYLRQHLRKGMTREEVHKVIHHSSRSEIVQGVDDPIEYERFVLDPLSSLDVEVGYKNGEFIGSDSKTPGFIIERHEIPGLIEVELILFIAGVGLLLISVLPFDQSLPPKTTGTG